MIIEELPDRKAYFFETHIYRNEPLLEYVWEVALEFVDEPSNFIEEIKESFAPCRFANRYAESKLTDEEKYARYLEMYPQSKISFEEYAKKYKYHKFNTSFKDKYLSNKDLQNTIEAYGLDVSKFWYLLLFVYDYIEDFGTNAPTIQNTTMTEFNNLNEKLEKATGIMLKTNGRKSYETDRDDMMQLLRTSLNYFINCYNNITQNESTREEQLKQIKELGLEGYINQWSVPMDNKNRTTLDVSHKKWYFAKMFLFFLENRKAKTLPHVKERVSKDKMMFVSRLIYTVGYHGEEYNLEYDLKTNNKNRMLSNLLRKYAKERFPIIVNQYYI